MSVSDKIVSVAKSISEGVATEEERGMALRSVQTNMAFSLITSMKSCETKLVILDNMLERLVNSFNDKLTVDVDAGSLSTETLFRYIQDIQAKQFQYLDLYRKIIQSPKGLFSEDVLSEEEKKVSQLFKSFKTQEERRKFLELCEKAFSKPVENFDE